MPPAPAAAERPHLLRVVSRFEVVALSVNDVIGSGVYLLPAQAALYLGGAAPLAVLGAGALVLLIVLCFAQAGSLFDEPGSAYVYTRAAFGDFIGFEVGWMTWIARVASVASLSAGFAQALGYLWSGAHRGVGNGLAITLPLVALTAINVIGVKHGARTAVALTIGKLVPLLAFVAVGIFALGGRRLLEASTHLGAVGSAKIGEAALLLLFAYAGFENTAAAAGEFRNPRRDVPFALLTQIGLVTALYTLVQMVAGAGLVAPEKSETPLADAMAAFVGPAGGIVLTLGALLSIVGTNSNTILAGPRYLYAISASGALPAVLARVHPRFHTPWIAILTMSAIALPLALSGSFAELALLSVIARLATYLGTAASVLVLRRRTTARAPGFRLPFGPVIPLAAIAVCLALVGSAGWKNLAAAALALGLGAALFYFSRQRLASSP